jgi:hypothetical protein
MIEAYRKGLEFFHVPCGDGEIVHTVTYTINTDGSVQLPSNLTPEQDAAMRAYITWGNEHMRELRGNTLSEMPAEKNILLDKLIDTLKTPEQKERERITDWTLQQHTMQNPRYQAFVSLFETSDHYKKDWLADRACAENDRLFDVHVTESYDGTFSYRSNHITTLYFLKVQPDGTIVKMHSRVEKHRSFCEEDIDE